MAKTFEATVVDPNTLDSKTYKGSFYEDTNNSMYSDTVKNQFEKIQADSTLAYADKSK